MPPTMNTATASHATPAAPPAPAVAAPVTLTLGEGYFARRTWGDWLFAAIAACCTAFALWRYQEAMDGYETAILLATLPIVI